MDEMHTDKLVVYAVLYDQGAMWDAQAAKRKEYIDGHIAYQREWLEAGQLIAGGPFLGRSGGMALFLANSEDEVAAILSRDPAVAAGVYKAECRRWHVRRSMLNL